MTVLVLGSTGQTGTAIAEGLQREGVPVRRTNTQGTRGMVRFVWGDPATHDDALSGVRAVYLLAPPLDAAPEGVMCPFIDRARAAGVRRFVLLGSSAVEEGEPGLGQVHHYLHLHAPEWAVLRPSWFMQNFRKNLATGESLVTATDRGKIAFVDVGDIARVAVRLLVNDAIRSADYILTGPEALSYDDVAAMLSEHTGRRILHRSVPAAERAALLTEQGVPPAYASFLASLDERIARGAEARTTRTVEEITGAPPRSLAAFLEGLAGPYLAEEKHSPSPRK